MREAGDLMDGLSLHYYTGVGSDKLSQSATEFGEEEWFAILKNASAIDSILNRQASVMDQYNPKKRVGLIVDEWGTWYAVEKGTNPGFLYQQNTLRDPLVAGLTLNAFNNHCDRVKMANIAQTVNVLQAVMLTQGEKMILTPTHYVFEMYKVHRDAALLPVQISSPDYEFKGQKLAGLSVSASWLISHPLEKIPPHCYHAVSDAPKLRPLISIETEDAHEKADGSRACGPMLLVLLSFRAIRHF